MKKHSVLLITTLVFLLSLTACGLRFISGSGNIITEERPVSDFIALNFTGAGIVTIIQGQSESLVVETDDNLMPEIETRVRNGVLTINTNNDNRWPIFRPSDANRFTLTVITLEGLSFSGAGTITADELRTGQLNIASSGAGEIIINQLIADTLNVNMSGAGRIALTGEVTNQNVNMSGLGTYEAGDLASQATIVSVSGAGKATVWAIEELDAAISGIGTINYYGAPRLNEDIAGIGWMNHLGEK